ncbi:hypothetical protein [Brevibacillus brevis]|uniref:hypothetical protein n=1 Tax=Brevibacillus brevis TaxID=1393 RepID=UPI001C8DCB9A|nr:hypothetical protein [Brevibacillus brevis]MBY0085414.1 hypothetical protein [Brevibacillus brevis]
MFTLISFGSKEEVRIVAFQLSALCFSLRTGETERFFSVKNVSTFFTKVDATACGQQNGHDRFVASESMGGTAE